MSLIALLSGIVGDVEHWSFCVSPGDKSSKPRKVTTQETIKELASDAERKIQMFNCL